ncbi:MAG TPA: hypothetical protein VKE22_08625 [Haliangiales bacterium]|nr:hypothetical protein [Haliangiales bacterium]
MARKNPNPNTDTSRLTRKPGAAPRVARKPRLAPTAVEELCAAAPPVEPPPAPPAPPAPAAAPSVAPARYTFRPAERMSARALLVAIFRRARREVETRTAPVRATLRSRFPWLPRFLVG